MSAHKFNPPLHAGVLIAQGFFVAIHQVQRPGVDHRSIRPGRRRVGALRQKAIVLAPAGKDIRHHMRDPAFGRLIVFEVGQPLGKEVTGLHQVTRGPAEYLRIPGPAQPLVALRAVGRDIDKVAFQPPQNVVVQLIQIRVGARKLPGAFHL
ncbi:hypothetical protein D3C75_849190 [compost metagenome]